MINSYCMDRIGNLHREMQLPWVALRRPQQQQRQQHYDDSNRLIDSALTLKSVLLWRSSDDLTTSNKDDVISPLKIVSHTITRSCFNFKLIFFFINFKSIKISPKKNFEFIFCRMCLQMCDFIMDFLFVCFYQLFCPIYPLCVCLYHFVFFLCVWLICLMFVLD